MRRRTDLFHSLNRIYAAVRLTVASMCVPARKARLTHLVPVPRFEVRDTSRPHQTRTSEAKGHWKIYLGSAAFRFEVPRRTRGKHCKNFKSAALLVRTRAGFNE